MNTKSKDYNEFLRSEYWRCVRMVVLRRDEFRCTKCGRNDLLLHVHHLSYDNHGEEHLHLEDLITMCEKCHNELHKAKSREKSKELKEKKRIHWEKTRSKKGDGRQPRKPRPPMSERRLIRMVNIITETPQEYYAKILCNGIMWAFPKKDCQIVKTRLDKNGNGWIFTIEFPRLMWKEIYKERKLQLKKRKTKKKQNPDQG